MKTYEGFISKFKDKIKKLTTPTNHIGDMVAAKYKLIGIYKENIRDFFIEKQIDDIKIYIKISGYVITINKNMDKNTYAETNINTKVDITDIYKEVQDYLYSLSDEKIEKIKMEYNLQKYNI